MQQQTDMTMTAPQQTICPDPRCVAEDDGLLPLRFWFEGSGIVLRAFFRFTGAVFILCAPGLWLLPGANADPSLMLHKLGVSIFFVVCGLALLLRGKVQSGPEVYFDPVRREMRILQRNERGRPSTVLRRAYASLGAVKFTDRQVEIWDVDGSVLLRLPLADPEARRVLRLQMGDLVR